MSTTADILVIGGGMAGISAAALLSNHAQVTVLEAEPHLGYHSTGRSAALFIRNYGNDTLRSLNALAYPVLSGQSADECFLSPRGELIVAQEHELSLLDDYLENAQGVERLTPLEAKDMVPPLKADKIAAAFVEQDAQDIDVDRLLQSYARLLRARGGRVITGQPAQSIERKQDRWIVQTSGETISAGVIVNAAGAWADEIASLAGVARIGLQPMRRSAVLMAVPDSLGDISHWPLFGSISEGWYAKPNGTGLMISPADEDPVSPQDVWPDDMVLAEGLDRFEQMVDIPIVRPSHSWAGLRTFATDRTPVVGPAADADGFFWLAGQGGYGIQTAPALAALTRDLYLGETANVAKGLLDAISPARFRE